jgi:hypothetical protein
MTCHQSGEITAFLKGEVPEKELPALRSHFDSCASCSRELETSRRLLESLSKMDQIEPSPGFTGRVRDAFLRAHPEFQAGSPVEKATLWDSIRAAFGVMPAWAISVSVHVLVVGIAALIIFQSRGARDDHDRTRPADSAHVAPPDTTPRDFMAAPVPDPLNQSRASESWKAWLDRMPRDARHAPFVAKRASGSDPSATKALAWLASAQWPGGRWMAPDPASTAGLTGLVLLAFLADGQAAAEPVQKGLEFLRSEQRASGLVGSDQGNSLLHHAIATVALLEGALATGDPRTRAAAAAAIGFSVSAQNEPGGWGAWARSPESDTLTGAWQILALRLSLIQGDAGVLPALVRAHGRIQGSIDPKGRVRGSAPGDVLFSTAAGMLSLELSSPAPDQGILARQEDLLLEAPVDPKDLRGALFRSLALFQRGGDAWARGWTPLREAVLRAQAPDGSWASDAVSEVHATALGALTLLSPVRYPRLSE